MNEPPPKSDVSMLSIPSSHIYYINNYSEVRQRLLESPLPRTLLFSSLAHRARWIVPRSKCEIVIALIAVMASLKIERVVPYIFLYRNSPGVTSECYIQFSWNNTDKQVVVQVFHASSHFGKYDWKNRSSMGELFYAPNIVKNNTIRWMFIEK